jgi:uncharacterized protein (TIGR03435 family)
MGATAYIIAVVALVLALAHLRGQSAATSAPPFEVGSVKPNVSRGIRGHDFPGDRFEARNVPLRDLIMIAYGAPGQMLPEWQITGPSWIDEDRFDISAKVGANGPNAVAEKQLICLTRIFPTT